jgi:hypothetical protein
MVVRFTPRALTLGLSIAILIKASRAFAQEDYAGYRHEAYREDGDRMSVNTDTVGFDVGLTSHFRLAASYVRDAISGATPIGTPPLNQWPQYTFNGLYPSAYRNQYNQLLSSATDPSGNLFSDYFNILFPQAITPASLKAFTNWVTSSGYQTYGPSGNTIGQDAGANATNGVNSHLAAQAATIAANSKFNSGKVQTVNLSDRRQAYNIAPTLIWDIHQLTPEYSYSREHDYHSYGAALNYQLALNNKNTILNAGWSHNVDRVEDFQDGDVWAGKVSDDVLVGINQLVSAKTYFTVNLTYAQEYGYLNDQYRKVILDVPQDFTPDAMGIVEGSPLGEARPRRRVKEILYGNFVHFFDAAEGSADIGYRFFHDSYGIFAHTIDLDWHQKLGRLVVFTPGVRYYYQSAAKFYYVLVPVDGNGNPPPNYASDYRLSRLETFTMTADFTIRIQKHVSLDLSYMRYVMHGLDGITSQSAYPDANVFSIGMRVWF